MAKVALNFIVKLKGVQRGIKAKGLLATERNVQGRKKKRKDKLRSPADGSRLYRSVKVAEGLAEGRSREVRTLKLMVTSKIHEGLQDGEMSSMPSCICCQWKEDPGEVNQG